MSKRKDTSAAELANLSNTLREDEAAAEPALRTLGEILQEDLRRFLQEQEEAAGFIGFAGIDVPPPGAQ